MNKCFVRRAKFGFTILEVLVALAASLFLMLGLTRAFKLIGDKITGSQSELTLSSELRDATFRLRDELRRLTPSMNAPLQPGKGGGYLHYYEGPWTDATTTLVHGSVGGVGVNHYHPTSRFGDLDDYLAFTTRSDPDKPFTGFVPAGILEAFRLDLHFKRTGSVSGFTTTTGKSLSAFTAADASAQAIIYSDVAEICYFLSPEWSRSRLGVPTIADPTVTPSSSSPEFLDVINEAGTATPGDGIPDRMTLRRRILLVREDLNMTAAEINKLNTALSAPLIASSLINPNDPIIPFLSGTTIVPLDTVAQFNPGDWGATPTSHSPNWLAGMARVHQWMDLSVSRHIYDVNGGTAQDPGTPVTSLRANSLEDLSSPENRFAAVRMPISLMSANSLAPFTSTALTLPSSATDRITSSMPLLALSPPHNLIQSSVGDGFIPTPSGDPLYNVMGGQAAASAPLHPFAMVGFVRPEFTLADHWYDFGTNTARPTLRGGSDIVANDLLAFDVQVYDPSAVVSIWTGPDGQPGVAGVNDDGDVDGSNNALVDNASELGYANSDDVLVDIGSKGMRTTMCFATTGEFVPVPYGAYVDNGYVRNAGGTLGGNNPTRLTSNSVIRELFVTGFSGYRLPVTGNSFPIDWQKSGKFVLSSGPVPSFYQPSIDTWTSTYDTDEFEQTEVTWPPLGTSMSPLTFVGNENTSSARSRYWSSKRRAFIPDNRFSSAPLVVGTTFSEADPPAASMPRALKITIRVYDRNAGEVRQQTIIEHF